MTVNAISPSIASNYAVSPSPVSRPEQTEQRVSQPAERLAPQPPQPLPQSSPSINTEGQTVGTRISTSA